MRVARLHSNHSPSLEHSLRAKQNNMQHTQCPCFRFLLHRMFYLQTTTDATKLPPKCVFLCPGMQYTVHAYLYHYSWRSLFFLHTVNIILLRTLTISCITKKIRLNLQGGILVSFSVQVEEISSYFDGILLIDAADDCWGSSLVCLLYQGTFRLKLCLYCL